MIVYARMRTQDVHAARLLMRTHAPVLVIFVCRPFFGLLVLATAVRVDWSLRDLRYPYGEYKQNREAGTERPHRTILTWRALSYNIEPSIGSFRMVCIVIEIVIHTLVYVVFMCTELVR